MKIKQDKNYKCKSVDIYFKYGECIHCYDCGFFMSEKYVIITTCDNKRMYAYPKTNISKYNLELNEEIEE